VREKNKIQIKQMENEERIKHHCSRSKLDVRCLTLKTIIDGASAESKAANSSSGLSGISAFSLTSLRAVECMSSDSGIDEVISKRVDVFFFFSKLDLQDVLVAMYVTGGDDIDTNVVALPRDSLEPREKKHKTSLRYFAEEQLCNNCGETGHVIRNCTKPYVSGSEVRKCLVVFFFFLF
jgi:hypothetical protein